MLFHYVRRILILVLSLVLVAAGPSGSAKEMPASNKAVTPQQQALIEKTNAAMHRIGNPFELDEWLLSNGWTQAKDDSQDGKVEIQSSAGCGTLTVNQPFYEPETGLYFVRADWDFTCSPDRNSRPDDLFALGIVDNYNRAVDVQPINMDIVVYDSDLNRIQPNAGTAANTYDSGATFLVSDVVDQFSYPVTYIGDHGYFYFYLTRQPSASETYIKAYWQHTWSSSASLDYFRIAYPWNIEFQWSSSVDKWEKSAQIAAHW